MSWVEAGNARDKSAARLTLGRGLAMGLDVNAKARDGAAMSAMSAASSAAPAVASCSELLMYALWRDTLSREPLMAELEALQQWPLVPVVSRGRRVLLQPALLPHVFCVQVRFTHAFKYANA